jgi:membrane-associated phospholipid phosphatase
VFVVIDRSTDPSFPSDHATGAFAIAVAVLLISWRVGLGFLLFAAAIAVSRVIVGVHYPSDVLAGAAIGSACAIVVVLGLRRPALALTKLLSRLTDPVLAPIWRTVARRDPTEST